MQHSSRYDFLRRLRLTLFNISLARKFYHESFGFNGGSEKGNVDQGRRYSDSTDSSSGGRTRPDRKRRGDDSPQSNRRKKARINSLESARIARGPQRRSLETFPVVDGDRLMIGDEKAVMAFYRRLLADGQQELCKKLAKWWIRAIHPNKQTNHPYAKGPEKKPPWWPLTPPNNAVGEPIKGTMENGFVRHKEPDHLSKAGENPLQR
jgi:hypothetical protein